MPAVNELRGYQLCGGHKEQRGVFSSIIYLSPLSGLSEGHRVHNLWLIRNIFTIGAKGRLEIL